MTSGSSWARRDEQVAQVADRCGSSTSCMYSIARSVSRIEWIVGEGGEVEIVPAQAVSAPLVILDVELHDAEFVCGATAGLTMSTSHAGRRPGRPAAVTQPWTVTAVAAGSSSTVSR